VNGNFLDVCVLEWCKLFGSKKDPHCWRKFVSDPNGFKADLLRHLSLDEAEFEKYVQDVLLYRDKFIAHLDSEPVMNIPNLDTVEESTYFYLKHVVTNEAQTGDLYGYEPYADPSRYYEQCTEEAEQQYNVRGSFTARLAP
jgi:hypothetical protein